MNAVTGTGNTRIAFIFQISTIAFYLFYLYLLSYSFTATLPVYLMAEYLFVILLGVQSYISPVSYTNLDVSKRQGSISLFDQI